MLIVFQGSVLIQLYHCSGQIQTKQLRLPFFSDQNCIRQLRLPFCRTSTC
jgi:hypothetical protein